MHTRSEPEARTRRFIIIHPSPKPPARRDLLTGSHALVLIHKRAQVLVLNRHRSGTHFDLFQNTINAKDIFLGGVKRSTHRVLMLLENHKEPVAT